MALVSPGLQITVTDESQYVSAAVGTVPLLFLATGQDKTINGSVASGTSAANAGQLQIFGSQRELVTALGYPSFKQTAAGTPIHGDERNEYGLMAAYSALGLGNRVYAIRADIDLDQLAGTSVRPSGDVPNNTYWFDLATTTWGIYEWDKTTQAFTNKSPIIITSESDTSDVTFDSLTDEPTPLSSIGQIGSYAVVATTAANRIFYKAGANTTTSFAYYNKWVPVGSTAWENSWPTLVGTATAATTSTGTIVINGESVTISSGTSIATAATEIQAELTAASVVGVTVTALNGKLAIYGTQNSESDGSTTNGRITISGTVLTQLGLTAGTYNTLGSSPTVGSRPVGVYYGSYASAPQWDTNGTYPAPSGALWLKTGSLGSGSNFSFKKYNSLTQTWTAQAVSSYRNSTIANYNLDPAGGGANVGVGTIFMIQDTNLAGTATLHMGSYRPRVRTVSGAVTAKASTVPASSAFVSGDTILLRASTINSSVYSSNYTITFGSTGGASVFVAAILAANVPYVTAAVESDGTISITHTAGGNIIMEPVGGTNYLNSAGFTSAANLDNVEVLADDTVFISGWDSLEYTYSITQPTANPADGTLWYYNDATSVDILVNDGQAWKSYRSLAADARGYNLQNSSPAGVIVTATEPTAQSDNSALVAGDLWLDTSDLENYPKLSRYNGTSWVAIDNTDQISQNGIIFADARWDVTGTTDPVSGSLPAITDLIDDTNNYVDLDCPDPQLYPRGILLFNTRRSGYNVKRFVSDYFTYESYNGDVSAYAAGTTYAAGARVVYGTDIFVSAAGSNVGNTPSDGSAYWDILEAGSWVSASGNKSDGSMYAGHQAQRAMIVEAIKSAVDSNTQIREDQFEYNLIAAPGYPEAISNMVALNNDRANTAFVIGDTPMTLSTNVVGLTNWSNGVTEGGLTTADPYLAVYYPSGLSNDAQGNPIMVPPSHMALRTYIRNDNLAYQWFAPAGVRRGLVDNVTDLGYLNATTGEFQRTGISQSLRDSLYTIKINPVTIITGTGVVVWGQKTRNPTTSSMDRVNVARLVNYIRTILAKTGNGFLFEPNDKITRDQIKAIIEGALNDLVAKRGIYDYLVVCDTSNNTSDRIARNELYVDIAIEPMKSVEFIYIPIRLLNPGSIGNLGS